MRTVTLRPSFSGALCGLWSFTWQTQLALRKTPGLAVTLLVIPVLTFLTIGKGAEPYYRWLVNLYFLLVVPLYSLAFCGGMIRDELQAGTMGFLVTRPLTRARLFLLKYLCHMAWLQLVFAVHAALMLLVGWMRDIEGVASVAPLFFGVQFLAVAAWTALASLLGLISKRYIVLGIIYGFVVEMGIGRIPTNINNLSLTRHVQTLLANNPAVAAHNAWPSDKPGLAVLILFIAIPVFLAMAAALFTWREYHQNDEMQK